MRLARQNIIDQVGQHILWAKLDENLSPCLVDIGNLITEEHRLEDVPRQRLTNGFRFGGVGLGGAIGVHAHLRGMEFHRFHRFGERLLGVPHQRRMEGCRNRQWDGLKTLLVEALLRARHGLLRPGDNHLVVRVQVSQGYLRVVRQHGADFFHLALHRHHGSCIIIGVFGRRHGFAARLGQRIVIIFVQHASSPQRGQFAEAVPGDKIGLETGLLEQLVQSHAERPNRRLRVLGAGQRVG